MSIHLFIGDVRKVYQKLADNSVDCIITSPPYWKQRDYKVEGQIGQESTPEEYAKEIANVFKLLWNKLKKTGTIFLNVGYKYYNEEFLLLPELIAIEMRKNGYILKNKIIWHKPNAMPTPARNRLNNTYEVILFFVKNVGKEVYYFNLDNPEPTEEVDFRLENLISVRVEDNITSREKRTGKVVAVNIEAKKVLVKWDDGREEIFNFQIQQEYAQFKCSKCMVILTYWDLMLSYANYGRFICRSCQTEELPLFVEASSEKQSELSGNWVYADSVCSYKNRITSAKCSMKYKKAGLLTASPSGRLAITGEKVVIKRKWIFPQPLIADYLRLSLKSSNINAKELDKALGYKHTAGHWLRKDFSYWGKGGSVPRPEDWIKLKEILKLDGKYDRLVCDLSAVPSIVKTHPKGKNIGDVWSIPTEPYSGDHFAVFPRKLVELCIKLGCPPNGVVLDPFAGSGTVGEVAKKLGISAILIEINEDYEKLILERCGEVNITKI